MKKGLFLLLCWAVLGSNALFAQEVGLRFGDMDGNNFGIDAVIPVDTKRIHATVSFGDNVGVDLLYDFAVNPIIKNSNFRYYAGIGLTSLFASELRLGTMGELGFEYRFYSLPLSVSLDYRPAIIIFDKTDFIYTNFGFNVRYVFK